MRHFLKLSVAVLVCLFVAQDAAAGRLVKLILKNNTDWDRQVVFLIWTKNGSSIRIDQPSWVIPPHSTSSRTFSAPDDATDHNIVDLYVSEEDTLITYCSVFPIPDIPIEFGSYIDTTVDTLFVGYDVRGPNNPVFCASPLSFDTLLQEYSCSDPTPTEPVLAGTVTTSFVGAIPTLTEWGMIIFCVLLFGWMAWVIVRRRRRVTAGI